jgi:hypothetical protein
MRTDIPSRNDVDALFRALEIEDEREKEALRKFYARERSGERWPVLRVLLGMVVFSALGYAILVLWMSL